MKPWAQIVIVALVAFSLSACYPPGAAPAPAPAPGPAPAPVSPTMQPAPTQPIATAVPNPAAATPQVGMPEALALAQNALAKELSVPSGQVVLARIEEAQWPNTCMGLGLPDQPCGQAITPGYRIFFHTPSGDREVRTNRTGSSVRSVPIQPTAAAPSGGTLLVFKRTGGVGGVCQQLTLRSDGGYLVEECRQGGLLKDGMLGAEDRTWALQLAERYKSIDWTKPIPAGAADMFNDHLTLQGKGQQTATAEELTAISTRLAQLYTTLGSR
jgi:hypothetical protein